MNRLTVILAVFLFILAGCGQSGPLYIGDNPSEIKAVPPDENADEEDDKE